MRSSRCSIVALRRGFDVIDDEGADLGLLIGGGLGGGCDGVDGVAVAFEGDVVGELDVLLEEFVVECVFDFFRCG